MSLDSGGKLLKPIVALACFIFLIQILYIHVNIEKPIQILNRRLEELNIVHPMPPLELRNQDEIGELYQHFNKMEERLRLARKEQTDMIAAMAHDLNTPLTSILGFAELLASHPDLAETEKQEYYELIQKKSKHMAQLINDFKRFTKEKLELESMITKPTLATKLFADIAQEYEHELAERNCALTCRHAFTDTTQLLVYEPMIRRVFGNLFSNTVRYGGKKELHVYLTGYLQGQSAYFQIEDNGFGVPDKDLSSLFLKFYTVDPSRQMQTGGLGLGLASCKSIIEYHGGEIEAFPSPYGGLGIRFSLPLLT